MWLLGASILGLGAPQWMGVTPQDGLGPRFHLTPKIQFLFGEPRGV